MRTRRALVTSALVALAGGVAGGVAWVIHVSLTKGLRAALALAQLGSAMLPLFGVVPRLPGAGSGAEVVGAGHRSFQARANRSMASRTRRLNSSLPLWPASSTMCSSASGHARASSQAVSAGQLMSRRP